MIAGATPMPLCRAPPILDCRRQCRQRYRQQAEQRDDGTVCIRFSTARGFCRCGRRTAATASESRSPLPAPRRRRPQLDVAAAKIGCCARIRGPATTRQHAGIRHRDRSGDDQAATATRSTAGAAPVRRRRHRGAAYIPRTRPNDTAPNPAMRRRGPSPPDLLPPTPASSK